MKTSQLLGACANLAAACAVLAAFGAPASAESFQKARQSVDQRLRSALQELGSTREKIAKEKIPLSKSVSALEDQVLKLRRKRDELVKVRDSRTIDLSSLRKQVDSYGDQEEFINGRLNEFVRDFESHLDISELPRYEKLTAAAKLAERNVNLDSVGKREAQVAVVEAALQRLRAILGGEIYAGEALSPEGVLTAGKFVALGPTTFFASEDGRLSGLVENQLNAADPVVVPLPGGLDSGVASVAQSGKGELPFDPTLGKALKTTKARETLVEHLRKGGAIGYVILLLGAVALGLTLFKGREILGFPVAAADEVDGVLGELSKGNREAAAWQAKQIAGVAGDMLTTGVEHADERRELLEELLFEKILSVRPTLERFLPFLAITAAAAPLLGLLGTVTGMIKTFELLTIFGTGDARSLSSGISQALVTTELGLMVAIPTLILHGALVRMAKRKLGLLEQLSMALVNGLSTIRFRSQSELAASRMLRDVREG
jgi:biopolymer transport protein ExbB